MVTRGWWAALVVIAGCEPAPDEPDGDDTDSPTHSETSPLTAQEANLISHVRISAPPGPLHDRSRLTCTYFLRVSEDQIAQVEHRWLNTTQRTVLGDDWRLTLTPEQADPGDEIRCRVRVVDIDGVQDEAAESRRVEPPQLQITRVSIQPDNPTLGQLLTCEASVHHSHNASTTTDETWRNLTQGTTLGTGPIWYADPNAASVGDEIACDVVARDTFDLTETRTATTTLTERPPDLSPIVLSPDDPKVGDTVTCDPSASHPDGLPIEFSTTWHNLTRPHQVTVDGLSLRLDPEHFEIGHRVRCTVTARGVDTQAQRTHTFSVDVENNRPPVVTDVRIDPPEPPTAIEPLVCSADAFDPDGTEPLLSYRWTQPGVPSWSHSGAVLPRHRQNNLAGTTLRCTATATDGTLNDTGFAEVSIPQVPPRLVFADISPRPLVSPNALLECTALVQSPHPANPTRTYLWRNLSSDAVLGDTLRLDLAQTPGVTHGDVIACEVEVSNVGAEDQATASVLVDASTPLGEVDNSPVFGPIRYIPSGTYVRGCDPEREGRLLEDLGGLWDTGTQVIDDLDDPCDPAQRPAAAWEIPAHPVHLTRALWTTKRLIDIDAVQAAGRSQPFAYYSLPSMGFTPPGHFPWMTSWADALELANEASAAEGLPPCYALHQCHVPGTTNRGPVCAQVDVLSPTGSVLDCEGWRLPTDAEWEYLSRGGEDIAIRLPWEHHALLSTWLATIGYTHVDLPDHSECLSAPNAFGLCDFSLLMGRANWQEWVWDGRRPYPTPPPPTGLLDPVQPPDLTEATARSGSRPFARRVLMPEALLGFRLVRTVE